MKNNTAKNKKKQYHHLTLSERGQIQAYINMKDENGNRLYNNSQIAKFLGRHRSTISRELKNIKSTITIRSGKIKNKPYNATDADNLYHFHRGLSKGEYKLRKFPKMKEYITNKIKVDHWAPDVIVGYMRIHDIFDRDGFTSISTPTVYRAIRLKIIDVEISDMRRMKDKPIYNKHEKKPVSEGKRQYSIELRPKEVENRLNFGHFELDTVLGKRNGVNECLMTLTERKTRFEMIFKLKSKSSSEVVKKWNQIKDFLKSKFNKIFKTITTDNGPEFSEFLEIIENTKAKIYFCHPYCSGEKGTNERSNEIIRYFIKKGVPIELFSNDDINEIDKWMNDYPRKSLGYKSPLEKIQEEFDDKSILNKLYKIQEKVNR